VGFQLECRWTFIDIRECEVTTSAAKRSESEPPPLIRSADAEAEDVDGQEEEYTTCLPERNATWSGTASADLVPE
ncbi:unnamed protein product, partial [Symbiodinium sp. KB8]